ncbi:MAG: 16S rRNA (cytosine(967)-C(5))-methyltransferase RsmB [Lachnospiraceae bacterium]|nr:16S rRNA (cytosine(967)-C(5))-methyltransferase RsmB [Lachnospiraceae bacterium]
MTNGVNTREIILDVLLAVTRDNQFCHVVLNDVLTKYAYLDKRDRSFISRVCHGTLERMPELDGILNRFSTVKVNKMKPVIRCILRSALYQMLYMDSVPDSAACNEAVKLAGKRGFKNLKAFVNGVLRNISRNKDRICYPDKSDFVNYMEKKYSILPWITTLWRESMEEDVIEEMGMAFLSEGPTSIRVEMDKVKPFDLVERLKKQNIEVTRHPEYEDVLYIRNYDSLASIEEFNLGLFYVQDVSSIEVGYLIKPKAGEVGMDVCAAPGGKSIHAASLMKLAEQSEEFLKDSGNKPGVIYSYDVTPYKVALIEENCMRHGITNIVADCHDARELLDDKVESADFVIADLPCSGLGVLSKKPDIKFHTSMDSVIELAKLQEEILDVVCNYVKKGGRLLYSTCTINHYENQDHVESFLKKHPEFSLVQSKQRYPKDAVEDGFYYALFQKGDK